MKPENQPATKEQIYDRRINPLMARIISICKQHKIAMLCTFAIPNAEDAHLYCATQIPDESGNLPTPIKEASRVLFGCGGRSLMLTTEHADGSKTLTAII